MRDPMDAWLELLDFARLARGEEKISASRFFQAWARGEAVLLDVRTPEEVALLSLPWALHVPLRELPRRKEEVPRDKLVAAFCSRGNRSAVAQAYLASRGWENVRNLMGGYSEFLEELMPGRILARRGKGGGEGPPPGEEG